FSQADQPLVRPDQDADQQGHALVLLGRGSRGGRMPGNPALAWQATCQHPSISGFSWPTAARKTPPARPGSEPAITIQRTIEMTVRAGREFLAIPGPTTMPDEVLQAMHRPALDIYSDQMINLTDGLMADLGKLFATKGKTYIYIANGHGAWEAVLSNVLSRGDKLLVLESGRFAINWGAAARMMGAEVEVLQGDWRRAVRP